MDFAKAQQEYYKAGMEAMAELHEFLQEYAIPLEFILIKQLTSSRSNSNQRWQSASRTIEAADFPAKGIC